MKKVIIPILFILMMIFSVSAIDITSISQVTFDTNNALYSGEAFVISGVENGGQDTVLFQIAGLETKLPEGYTMERSGTIGSKITNYRQEFPLSYIETSWEIKKMSETKFFLSSTSASDWCAGLISSGQGYVTDNVFNVWSCYEYSPTQGYFYQLQSGRHKYDLTYTLDVYDFGIDKVDFKITDTSKATGTMIGDKNWFQARVTTHGVTAAKPPDLDNKMILHYSLADNKYRILKASFETKDVDYDAASAYFTSCIGFTVLGDSAVTCMNKWNANVMSKLSLGEYYSISINPYTKMNAISINEQTGVASGSILFDDGNLYINPIVTLTIKADKVGIQRVFGKGDITSIQVPPRMDIGQIYDFSMTIENVGDATMDALLKWNCKQYAITGFSQFQSGLKSGEPKTLNGRITPIGSLTGCGIVGCSITIQNSNTITIDDTYSFSSQTCQKTECKVAGISECIPTGGNIIKTCTLVNGVLVYQNTAVCTTKCVELGTRAFCDDNVEPKCGDGVCAIQENEAYLKGNTFSKYWCSDWVAEGCELPPPTCGDAVCDGREKKGQLFQCVIGIDEKKSATGIADCPDSPKPPNVLLIIILSLGGLGLAGSIAFRMKKEGIF